VKRVARAADEEVIDEYGQAVGASDRAREEREREGSQIPAEVGRPKNRNRKVSKRRNLISQ